MQTELFSPLQEKPGILLKRGDFYTTIAISVPPGQDRERVTKLETALERAALRVQNWYWVSPTSKAYVLPQLSIERDSQSAEFCASILESEYGQAIRYLCNGSNACTVQPYYLSLLQKLSHFFTYGTFFWLRSYKNGDPNQIATRFLPA